LGIDEVERELSKPREPEPVKLFVSVLAGDAGLLQAVIRELAERHGDPDYVSEIFPFAYTNYYADEMGPSLVRRFVAFGGLIRPEELPAIKLETNALEGRLSEGGARQVNVDPGYVAKQHFILATGKGFSHRPYIGQGIYADLTLVYRKETYRPLEWTYPDYRSEQTVGMLNKLRRRYMIQLKTGIGHKAKG
jgi:hypothetical protein